MNKNFLAQSIKSARALLILSAALPFAANADTITKRLEKPSGERAHFSAWYELCSDPIPANHVIIRYQFVLEGDRRCGAWSRCEVTKNSPREVCVSFSLQGHSENILFMPDNGSKNSTGVLKITTATPQI